MSYIVVPSMLRSERGSKRALQDREKKKRPLDGNGTNRVEIAAGRRFICAFHYGTVKET